MSEQNADGSIEQTTDQSQSNPVADNADGEVLPQSGKPSQAEGDDEGLRSGDAAGDR